MVDQVQDPLSDFMYVPLLWRNWQRHSNLLFHLTTQDCRPIAGSIPPYAMRFCMVACGQGHGSHLLARWQSSTGWREERLSMLSNSSSPRAILKAAWGRAPKSIRSCRRDCSRSRPDLQRLSLPRIPHCTESGSSRFQITVDGQSYLGVMRIVRPAPSVPTCQL